MSDDAGITLLSEGRDTSVVIDYTNWKGERSKRVIEPLALSWGKTDWHPEPGLILLAYDLDRRRYRDFAVKDIHGVERVVRGTEE